MKSGGGYTWILVLYISQGGHSHMLVDIKCLSIDPLFYADPTPNDPLFSFSPHPMTPFFHFCIKFYIKIANFCTLRAHFEQFYDFVAILTENLQILPWNCTLAHWMTPISGSPHQKSPYFFFFFFFLVPTPNDPLFSTKSYTECPLFSFYGRHLYVTFIFECPPGVHMHDHRFSKHILVIEICLFWGKTPLNKNFAQFRTQFYP